MKAILYLFGLTLFPVFCFSQQGLFAPNSTIGTSTSGVVGVNTSTPLGEFQVNSIRPVIIKTNGGSGIYGSEIGFNAVLDTSNPQNTFTKLGNTSQLGGASIAVDYRGNMLFQMYNANTLSQSTINYSPQITFANSGNLGIGITTPEARLHISGGHMVIDAGATTNPTIYTGTGTTELNRYLTLNNSPGLTSASGLKAGGILVSDSYGYANPTKNDLIVKGNVGIGTPSPVVSLDVNGVLKGNTQFHLGSNYSSSARGITVDNGASTSWEFLTLRNTLGTHFLITGSGNVGIGTTSPSAKLQVSNGGQHIKFATGENSSSYTLNVGVNDDGVNFSNNSSIRGYNFSNQNGTLLKISNTGNVGIGTINPDTKLAVKGTIHTEEVRVDVNVPVPDYVFEKDYNLLPLSEVEAYVNQNKHLPEVPSAKDMEENGLNLKEMNLLLLKKVEELTLHLIEQNKKIESQNLIILDQNDRLKKLEQIK